MYKNHVKSALDIVFSAVGLLILFIPFILVALAIKLDSRGPVFLSSYDTARTKSLFWFISFAL
jgi:O-antigen biosynthesis protein WbqP